MDNPIISLLKNKYILLGASFLIVLLFLLLTISMLRNKKVVPPINTPENVPLSPSIIIPTVPVEQTFVISGVTVKNFYKTPEEKNTTNDVLFFGNEDYTLTYAASFEQFYITVNNANFLQIREIAEQKFLTTLGITKTDACKLKVEESVPLKSQSVYAGGVYPLSFCENSN